MNLAGLLAMVIFLGLWIPTNAWTYGTKNDVVEMKSAHLCNFELRANLRHKEMIDTLKQVCITLATEPLTAQETAIHLGRILEDKGDDLPLIFKPSDVHFSDAKVVRRVGTNEPAYVTLTLVNPDELTVETLKKAFGEYRELLVRDMDRPQRVLFDSDIMFDSNNLKFPHTCDVIADIKLGDQGLKNATVSAVTIRCARISSEP